ncbi:MAG: 4Fe-4S dicluster domain-containing protein [Firmicutes bacterium]|nr:4Fe-4S dicluster domain-containing protein [Bacillota bacterium]
MGEAIEIRRKPGDEALLAELKEQGVSILSCYQCGKCTAGCPVAFAMDYGPRTIVRFMQLGMIEEALKTHSIWICAACETCSARCPRGVEPAKLMDALRVEAGKKGQLTEKNIKIFNDSFLQMVKLFGRVHELGLIMAFNLKSLQPFKDAAMGPTALGKGKMHLMPHKIKGLGTLRRVFDKTKGGEGH